jgi:hypothetical protein
VLAEDKRHQSFVKRYLKRRKHDGEVRLEPLPSATGGAGDKWVRERYAAAVKAYRTRAARTATALVVVIDADKLSVVRRAGQLESALKQAHMGDREAGEVIVHFIPRRHIETWILHLSGSDVDEEADYHNEKGVDDLIQSAAAAFHGWTSQPPAKCLPSLDAALQETKRLA